MQRPLFTAAALSSVKLKSSSDQMRDFSAPKFVAALDSIESRVDVVNIWYDANIEEWIQLLGAETFSTRFLTLSPHDAIAIVHTYQQQFISKPAQPIEAEHIACLKQIESRLEAVMNQVKSERYDSSESAQPDEFVFVKTSCRSPKDTVLFNSNFKQGIIQALQRQTQACGRSPSEATENDCLISLFSASIDCLKSRNAAEVIQMFISSERVWNDLSVALEFREKRGWNQNFVVRQWFDIECDMEFRGFVKRGKLNGLSQYNHLFCSPRLVAARDAIGNAILTYFEQRIQPLLGSLLDEQGYVVDFALCGKLQSSESLESMSISDLMNRIKVIELNPFAPTTDAALFSWNTDHALLSGDLIDHPFQFRVRDAESQGAKASLMDSWRTILEQTMREIKSELPVSA